MKGLLIVGAGGHGKVVADTAKVLGQWDRIAFLDKEAGGSVCDCPILGTEAEAQSLMASYPDIAVAVGDNPTRVKLLAQFLKMGFNLPSIIHPMAYVSSQAVVGSGTVVFAQAAVNAGTEVGLGCIINTGATVDHDCVLEEGVHLSPGAHLAGKVRIGRHSWIGIGASVIQQVTIGENVIIGAGTVVIRPIEDGVTVVGVPGRVIGKNE